jgi:hypothetical protein
LNVVGGVTITIHCTSAHMAALFPSVFSMCTEHPTTLQMAFGRVELVHKNNYSFFRQRTANSFHHHRSCNIFFQTLSAEEVSPKQNHCPRGSGAMACTTHAMLALFLLACIRRIDLWVREP